MGPLQGCPSPGLQAGPFLGACEPALWPLAHSSDLWSLGFRPRPHMCACLCSLGFSVALGTGPTCQVLTAASARRPQFPVWCVCPSHPHAGALEPHRGNGARGRAVPAAPALSVLCAASWPLVLGCRPPAACPCELLLRPLLCFLTVFLPLTFVSYAIDCERSERGRHSPRQLPVLLGHRFVHTPSVPSVFCRGGLSCLACQ